MLYVHVSLLYLNLYIFSSVLSVMMMCDVIGGPFVETMTTDPDQGLLPERVSDSGEVMTVLCVIEGISRCASGHYTATRLGNMGLVH